MKSPTRNTFIPLVIVLFGMLLLSCSSEEENSSEQVDASAEAASDRGAEANEEEKEPVTVQVQVHWEEQMFNERFKNPVEEHFPHITLEQIQSGSGRDSLEELFATGQSPDIFFEVSQRDLEYFELEYDLDEMVDKHNYDLSHINPVFLDALRARDFEEQRLLGMPYEAIYHVLFYNKEIFDLFGEDYPTAGMTWDDALELARSVSGERDGVEYRGLDLSNTSIPLLQLSVNKTDPETGEVMLDQPELSMYLELIDNIINLPGYGDENYFGASRFHEEQTTAMLLNFVQGIEWWSEAEENEGLNMDVTAMPVFSDRDPVTHLPNIIPLSINPHSEVKDAAFDVITFFTEMSIKFLHHVWDLDQSIKTKKFCTSFSRIMNQHIIKISLQSLLILQLHLLSKSVLGIVT